MKSVTVTYHAPKGDTKVTEAFGHTFHDGKSETIEVDDDTLMRLQSNQVFECGEPSEAKPKAHEQPKHDKDDDDPKHDPKHKR